jgi:hypothetical protein
MRERSKVTGGHWQQDAKHRILRHGRVTRPDDLNSDRVPCRRIFDASYPIVLELQLSDSTPDERR